MVSQGGTLPDAARDRPLNGLLVLVIEDEFLVAMEFETFLQQQGCTILGPAATVAQALDLLDGGAPDAALLDMNLRGERAVRVAAALRARAVPFVLVTGYGRVQLSEPELQDVPHLPKPVNYNELVRAIARAVDAGRRH